MGGRCLIRLASGPDALPGIAIAPRWRAAGGPPRPIRAASNRPLIRAAESPRPDRPETRGRFRTPPDSRSVWLRWSRVGASARPTTDPRGGSVGSCSRSSGGDPLQPGPSEAVHEISGFVFLHRRWARPAPWVRGHPVGRVVTRETWIVGRLLESRDFTRRRPSALDDLGTRDFRGHDVDDVAQPAQVTCCASNRRHRATSGLASARLAAAAASWAAVSGRNSRGWSAASVSTMTA